MQLDTRGVSLLLRLEGDWADALRAYLDEIGAEEDVTLVLEAAPGADRDDDARRGRGRCSPAAPTRPTCCSSRAT